MDQLALQNINTLLNMNEKTSFIFNNKEIIIDEENSDNSSNEYVNTDNNLNDEYTLYFTFNQLFNMIRADKINRQDLISDMNRAFNNLYDNEHFLKLLDNDKNLEQVGNDIDEKLDFINERYPDNACSRFTDKLFAFFDCLISEFAKNIPKQRPKSYVLYNNITDNDDNTDDSDNTDDDSGDENKCDEFLSVIEKKES